MGLAHVNEAKHRCPGLLDNFITVVGVSAGGNHGAG